MSSLDQVLALIPARGGSIGVKGKNVRELHGKPLILHTLDFALEENWFHQVVVSTDNSIIGNVASRGLLQINDFEEALEDTIWQLNERSFVHKRKAKHSKTLSPIREFLFEFIEEKLFGDRIKFIMMLQPTSPFRNHEEIKEIRRIAVSNMDFSSLVSITPVGGFHPDRMYRLKHDYIAPYVDQQNKDNKPRQLLEELYIKDGAYYLLREETLRRKTLLGAKPSYLIRQGLCTINIDDEKDFSIAELVTKPY